MSKLVLHGHRPRDLLRWTKGELAFAKMAVLVDLEEAVKRGQGEAQMIGQAVRGR